MGNERSDPNGAQEFRAPQVIDFAKARSAIQARRQDASSEPQAPRIVRGDPLTATEGELHRYMSSYYSLMYEVGIQSDGNPDPRIYQGAEDFAEVQHRLWYGATIRIYGLLDERRGTSVILTSDEGNDLWVGTVGEERVEIQNMAAALGVGENAMRWRFESPFGEGLPGPVAQRRTQRPTDYSAQDQLNKTIAAGKIHIDLM